VQNHSPITPSSPTFPCFYPIPLSILFAWTHTFLFRQPAGYYLSNWVSGVSSKLHYSLKPNKASIPAGHCEVSSEFPFQWLHTQKDHAGSMSIKIQVDATVCRYLFTAKSLYMFRVSQHPSSGVLKTVTAASGTGHNIGTATSLRDLYRRLRLEFLVLLMMGAVTSETCRVTLQ